MTADRTRSARQRAGSRRNRKYRTVPTFATDRHDYDDSEHAHAVRIARAFGVPFDVLTKFRNPYLYGVPVNVTRYEQGWEVTSA